LIKAGKFHWEVYDEKDVQIRIYNDAAVVMGTFELKGAGARWGEPAHLGGGPRRTPRRDLALHARLHPEAWKVVAGRPTKRRASAATTSQQIATEIA